MPAAVRQSSNPPAFDALLSSTLTINFVERAQTERLRHHADETSARYIYDDAIDRKQTTYSDTADRVNFFSHANTHTMASANRTKATNANNHPGENNSRMPTTDWKNDHPGRSVISPDDVDDEDDLDL